eukprot:TRINITY_DN5189_c0_g1_i1.p1 TRINITY_DN5189_c0_g1~~TRINITY_DN5189_c0_g1_i1.p1  ORF type:complete len:147 (+),score=11.65 TRINITY_DN5189_c0_g1_i1:47-487(+)
MSRSSMNGGRCVVVVMFVLVLLINTSHSLLSSSINCSLVIVADNSFEAYHNNISNELEPGTRNVNQAKVDQAFYHTKYCVGYESNILNNGTPRCDWGHQDEDIYNIPVQNQDVILFKYYNFITKGYNLTYMVCISFLQLHIALSSF